MGTAGDGERSEISASQIIPNFAYARFGEMLGFKGIFVYKPGDLHGVATGLVIRPADRPRSED
jgi:hypothetical protein